MASYADSKYAARWEAAFGKKIRRLYGQAQKEVQQKMEDFTKKHQEKDALMRAKLNRGEITEAEYMQWLQGQVFIGGRWRQKVVEISKVYVNADKKARELVRDVEYSEFTSSSNYQAWDIEKNTHGAVSFDLYDDRAVTRLIRDNPQMLPKWKIDEKKDYVWNEKRVRNSVIQAIIQGESMDKLAKRLSSDLSTSNGQHMMMFARTAVTGAQNEGSLQRMRDAEDLGLKVQKRWLATLDSRTRDSHADLDGQTVDVDEPFVTKDGTKIMCPGDPSAPPEEVCNCRCTMITVYPQYENLFSEGERRAKEETTDAEGKTKTTEKVIPYQTYSQWAAAKQAQDEPKKKEKAKAEPKSPWFDSGNLNVVMRGRTDLPKEEVDKALSLAGADFIKPTEDDYAKVTNGNQAIVVRVRTDDIEVEMDYMKSDNSLYIEDVHVTEQGQGYGTKWMEDVIDKAKEAGLDSISLFALRDASGTSSGYYAWARMGFDGELSEDQKALASQHGFEVTRVSELMATEEGRSYWKKHGTSIPLKMDLRSGSGQLKAFNQYAGRAEPDADLGSAEPADKGFISLREDDVKDVFGKRPDRALRLSNPDEYQRQREEYESSSEYQWKQQLTSEEVDSISDYTGDSYSAINGLCRSKMTERMVRSWDVTAVMPIEEEIKQVESALSKFELREDITLYRTCEMDLFEELGLPGDLFKDNGFCSCSITNTPVASGPVDVEIKVPKGMGRGAWVRSLSNKPEENEFLLQRGSIFEIESMRQKSDGRWEVKLRWIGAEPDGYRYASKKEVIDWWKLQGIYSPGDESKI